MSTLKKKTEIALNVGEGIITFEFVEGTKLKDIVISIGALLEVEDAEDILSDIIRNKPINN